MEELGDESEDVYDQFDLGDFTKEEIKAYEAMVGPGERLRDAAPPKRSLAEMRETSCERIQKKEKNYWLAEHYAGQTSLACTGQRTKGSSSFTMLPRELHGLVEAGISNAFERAISEGLVSSLDDSLGPLQGILMDEIFAPAPQISQFIRDHDFVSLPYESHPFTKQTIRNFYHPSGSLKSAQRQFEQDVYNLARNMGLSMDEAEQWVLKAREVCSEMTYGDWLTEESDNDEIHRMEEADRTKAEKAARKYTKKARIAERQAQKIARRQTDKTDSQRSNKHPVARPEDQEFLPNNPEHPTKVEDQDQPLKQKKQGRKRKRELELSIHLVEPSEDYHKHKKGKVDGVAQDTNFKKTKRKKDVGPQHSPFFQRSSGVKPKKKERARKVQQVMGFQPPMIR